MKHKRLAALSWLLALGVIGLWSADNAAHAVSQFIKHGTEEEAVGYYDRISTELGFQVEGAGLTELVAYLGLAGISARDLEFIDPIDLMASTAQEIDRLRGVIEDPARFDEHLALKDFSGSPILASRFMAPKIVDVSGAPPYQVGWRKLVRILAREGSDADSAGVASAFIMFNYTRAQDDPSPFPNLDPSADASVGRSAQNIQVMLVPKPNHPSLTDGVYFIVFGGQADDYATIRFVQSGFDLPPDLKSDGNFYVPTACGRCHGDVGRGGKAGLRFPYGKLNFLDTDYWHDRAQTEDFFAEAGALHGVLFDGGRDQSSGQFAAAFEVVRTLNNEIAEQNEQSGDSPNAPNYQLRGAQKWQEVHTDNVQHVAPLGRALGSVGDGWSDQFPDDEPLLAKLNRHCYRCHSSIRFNVFDKAEFKGFAKSAISSVMFGIMPLGHNLATHEPQDAEELVERLKQLLAQ